MLQSLYTAAVADQLITAKIDAAHRSAAPRRRRLFSRGDRGAAPRSAPHGRLRFSGAGR
jgi:hypothetical protein